MLIGVPQTSLCACGWALSHRENETVELTEILPQLKAVIAAAREREEMEQAIQEQLQAETRHRRG